MKNPGKDGVLDRLGRLGSWRTPQSQRVADGAGVGAAEGALAVESAGARDGTVGWGPLFGNSFLLFSFEGEIVT